MDYLHDRGYNFFNIPSLTMPEINMLIEQNNTKVRQQEREARKAKSRK